jgi:thiamine biosynthesis lipoprotein
MGTLFRVVLHADSEPEAAEAAHAALSRVHELDARLSDYIETSELSRLSASAGSGMFVPASDDLWNVLTRAARFGELSCGAFDVIAGSVIELWRRARRQGELPGSARLESARAKVSLACKKIMGLSSSSKNRLMRGI